MVDEKEWASLTPDQLNAEILERRALKEQMVGWLYPSILMDQIMKLRFIYQEKTGKYDHQ